MFKPKKIVVTNHAIKRLKERFYWRFYNYFDTDEITKNLIHAQVSVGTKLDNWKMVPFHVNRLGTKYGKGTEIILMSGVYYLCVYDGTTLIVKTCVNQILGYNKIK